MGSYERLLEQVDIFIRKFYKKELLRGLIWLLGVFLLTLLIVSGLEYIGRFNSYVRAVLLFGFLLANGFILIWYVVRPLAKLYRFGARISNFQAAKIIGDFFPEVSDRLLNTLQLNDSDNDANYELIRASVKQKAHNLSGFSFGDAVNFSDNWKYVKYLSPLFGLFLIVAVFVPDWLTEGTKRVVNFQDEFVPQAPFVFDLKGKEYLVDEGEDLELSFSLKGDIIPSKAYVNTSKGRFLMEHLGKGSFSFWLTNVIRSEVLSFEAMGFSSEEVLVRVIPNSSIAWIKANVVYPDYLGLDSESFQNIGDLTVPEGTVVNGVFKVRNVKDVLAVVKDKEIKVVDNTASFSSKFSLNGMVQFSYLNGRNELDSLSFPVRVVKDEYPQIRVNERIDSTLLGRIYFNGNVNDDHGIRALNFVYEVVQEDGSVVGSKIESLNVQGSLSEQFDFLVDLMSLDLSPSQKVKYWFEVGDNDGVNGTKWTKSSERFYEVPGLKEISDKRKEEQKNVNDQLKQSIERSLALKKDVERLKKSATNSTKDDFKLRNEVQRLQKEQQSLLDKLKKLDEDISKSRNNKESVTPMDEELKQMEEAIQDLLKEVMDEEMMELLEKLEELLKNQNKEQFQEELEKLDMSAEDQKKQMERSLEMLKRLQVNERIDELEERLNSLAEEQRDLKKTIEEKSMSKEEKEEKQDDLNKEFDDLKKDLDEMHQLNEELKDPLALDKQEDSKENVDSEMKEAKEKLGKGQDKKAGGNQKNAAEKMEEMAEELNAMQEESNEQQAGEDLESLKQILQNLMTLSFDQEQNIERFSVVADNDPSYQRYAGVQRKIFDNTKAVADSLNSLANRQPKIASFIDKELGEIKRNQNLIVESIDEHKRRDLTAQQQFVMTSYNNLALLLNESLEQMQNQMKSQKPGQGSCNKPGGKGKPKPGAGMGTKDMKQMLKEQLEQMEKGMGKGPKPGEEGKPGSQGQPKDGMGGFGPKQISKMAAEQSAIRERLEQLRDELNKDGSGSGNKLNDLIDELEKQEDDLINRRIDRDLIDRQQEILTRMLESEKAINERGFEEKRESSSGKNKENGNLIRFDEYNNEKRRQIELIRSVNPGLKKYYKDKANDYYNKAL